MTPSFLGQNWPAETMANLPGNRRGSGFLATDQTLGDHLVLRDPEHFLQRRRSLDGLDDSVLE